MNSIKQLNKQINNHVNKRRNDQTANEPTNEQMNEQASERANEVKENKQDTWTNLHNKNQKERKKAMQRDVAANTQKSTTIQNCNEPRQTKQALIKEKLKHRKLTNYYVFKNFSIAIQNQC